MANYSTITLCTVLLVLTTLAFASQRLCPQGKIWKPTPGTTWQWQIGESNGNTSAQVQMYDIDMFDVTAETIDALHSQGKIVICYFSAGTYEDWRPDAKQFPASVLGNSNGWPGERWLDIRKETAAAVYTIMTNRFSYGAEKGCDGIEPDNIDGYCNDSGFPLTAADQIYYNTWLANEAHKFNLSIGLKNDLDQIPQLESYFDWALDEQCYQYSECDSLKPFIAAGKAVFGTEYTGNTATFCPYFDNLNYSWLKKKLSLDSWAYFCLTNTTIPPPRCL